MTIHIVGLERHEQRYTTEWASNLPEQIRQAYPNERVKIVYGAHDHQVTSPGAFLDFAGTNVFKGEQCAEIGRLFQSGQVAAGDTFLFTDAWHFGVIATRYTSDLLGIPVRIVGLHHAGSHDPHDFLGRLGDSTWLRPFERSIFEAMDVNVFATRFHIDLYRQVHVDAPDCKVLQAGWPMEYLTNVLGQRQKQHKRKLVLFPHRLAPEKQVEIFRDLGGEFPDFEFRVCQQQRLTKEEYHSLLDDAAAVFSCSLQETLGIAMYEGLLCGAMPIAPARLSYSEMYPTEVLYPSEWTESEADYRRCKLQLVEFMRVELDRALQPEWQAQTTKIADDVGARFFTGDALYAALRGPLS